PAGAPGARPATCRIPPFPLAFPRYRRLFQEGARLITPSIRQIPAVCIDPRVKMRSRLHWWLADREAHLAEPGSTALLLDLDGHVTETAAANFLIVQGGKVLTPPRS